MTDGAGNYVLADVRPGTWVVREELPEGWLQTYPAYPPGQFSEVLAGHSVTVPIEEAVSGIDFGVRRNAGEVLGTVWRDLDGDKLAESGEPSLAWWQVFVDYNGDGEQGEALITTWPGGPGSLPTLIVVTEPVAVTDEAGNYVLEDVRPGTWVVREELPEGWLQTYPAYPPGQFSEVLAGHSVGGSLTVRGCTVEETIGGNKAAIDILGGTVDLGTPAEPGNNTIGVHGRGELIRNAAAGGVWAVGNTLLVDGEDITANPYRIEDEIVHALDAGGGGLVTYVPDNVFVTHKSGSVQRGVNAVAEGGTVHVEAGFLRSYDGGAKLLTVTFEGGPTLVLEPDPQQPGATQLVVTGAADSEWIGFEQGKQCGEVTVRYNGVALGTHRPSSRVIAQGEAGNDILSTGCLAALSAWLYGGEGNDILTGGSRDDVLVGGEGNDLLVGGLGRDLLIGGNGCDILMGGCGEDILIAGRTTFDDFGTANDAALHDILGEWSLGNEYSARIEALRAVLHILFGLLGRDWFFADLTGEFRDWIADRSPNEFVADLQPT